MWEYNNAGNITARKQYSNSALSLGGWGQLEDTVSYDYGEKNNLGGWGDLLTGYDGKSFTYDTIGNLTSDTEWTYNWEKGRQLASMSNGTATWSFTYDADGMRTGRTNGTTAYGCIYNGGQLTQMTVNGKNVTFSELMEDEYLVVLKTSTKPSTNKGVGDYHFVVRLSNGTWADKEGHSPSRWNGLNGFAKVWDKFGQPGYYNSDPVYYAVKRRP